MFIQRISPTLIIIGSSCLRIKNTLDWFKILMPTVSHVNFYVQQWLYESEIPKGNEIIHVELHDIKESPTKELRKKLCDTIIQDYSNSDIPTIYVIQDPSTAFET